MTYLSKTLPRVLFAFLLLCQSFLGNFAFIGNTSPQTPLLGGEGLAASSSVGPVVYADHEEWHDDAQDHDLAILKSIKSQTATSVVYRIAVSEVNGLWVNGVTVEDLYSSGLTYVWVVASSPMFSNTSTFFIHDTFTPKLRWQDMVMPAGGSEWIEIEFAVEEWAGLANVAQTSACNAPTGCEDQFINVSSQAAWYIKPTQYIPPPYDMTIQKIVANCTGVTPGTFDPESPVWCTDTASWWYELWDEVYFTLKYTNNGPNAVDYAILTDEYDTRLSFDSVLYTSQWLPAPYVGENIGYDADGDWFAEPHNYLSFSDGFPMAVGQQEVVVLKFVIDNLIWSWPLLNDTAVWVPYSTWALGSLYFYEAPFGTWTSELYTNEQFDTNNTSADAVEIAMRDLWIEKELISPATPSWNNTITYRITLENDGAARNDIAVQDIWNGFYSGSLVWWSYGNWVTDVWFGPGDPGHYFDDFDMSPVGIAWWYNILPENHKCDLANNCDETLRWGNIEMDAYSTWYIDVEILLWDDKCVFTYTIDNEARISLTNNTITWSPTFLPLYHPDPFHTNRFDDQYLSLELFTDEWWTSDLGDFWTLVNVDNASFDIEGTLGCDPGIWWIYDLSIIKTVDETEVCPGEEVTYTMTLYNSGSVDKHFHCFLK